MKKFEAGLPRGYRGRTNLAHVRQSQPDSGLGFQARVSHYLNAAGFGEIDGAVKGRDKCRVGHDI